MGNGRKENREVDLRKRVLPVVAQARELVITTREDCDRAAEILQATKALLAESDAVFGPVMRAALESHRAAVAAKKKVDAPLKEAQGIIRPKVAGFLAEEDRRRREAEARAREQAERALLDEAVALEAAGDPETAQVILEAAPTLAVRSLPTYRPEGVTPRESWKFEVISLNQVPREYLVPDEQKIGAVVRALKDKTAIPGVRVWREARIAVGKA